MIVARGGARAGLTALALLAATGACARAATAARPHVAPRQELAVLRVAQRAMARPSERSTPVRLVGARRPITGERTVLPVLGHRTARDGRRWLRVRLPGRPNGHTGWIRRRRTVASATSWHIVVDTARRRTIVYHRGLRTRVFRSIVGKPSTPTPLGEFFVEETVELRARDVGAPYALALSARSDVFQEFDGGPGQIALHGLAHIGGVLGTATSHGCVRLDSAALRWLVLRIGPGVPVTVVG